MPFLRKGGIYKPTPDSGPWTWRQWRDIPIGTVVARFSPYTTDPDVRKDVEYRVSDWSYIKKGPSNNSDPDDWCMVEARDLPPEVNEWGEVCY